MFVGGAPGLLTVTSFLWQPEMPSMITRPALSSNELRYACFIFSFLLLRLFYIGHARPGVLLKNRGYARYVIDYFQLQSGIKLSPLWVNCC